MVMTDEELLREMRQAKDPAAHVQVLAELNAVATDTMRECLRDLGVDLPSKRRRPRRFDEARARELLEAGKTDAEVAAALGVARRSIYDFREAQGIPLVRQRRGRKPRPPGPDPAVPALPRRDLPDPPQRAGSDAGGVCGAAQHGFGGCAAGAGLVDRAGSAGGLPDHPAGGI